MLTGGRSCGDTNEDWKVLKVDELRMYNSFMKPSRLYSDPCGIIINLHFISVLIFFFLLIAFKSCNVVLETTSTASNGIYWLKNNNSPPQLTYCQMVEYYGIYSFFFDRF